MRKKTAVFFLEKENTQSIVERVSSALKRGEVCIIPTDTLYGIVALDCCKEAVDEIYRIKGRPRNKPLIRLIGSLKSLGTYTNQPLPGDLKKYWPGPLTIIFRGIQQKKVSIRFPSYDFLREIFQRIGYDAIVAPSANLSGEVNIFHAEQLIETFSGKVDIIVCKKGGLKAKRPSTIIDISQKEWRVVREGAVKLDIPWIK